MREEGGKRGERGERGEGERGERGGREIKKRDIFCSPTKFGTKM